MIRRFVGIALALVLAGCPAPPAGKGTRTQRPKGARAPGTRASIVTLVPGEVEPLGSPAREYGNPIAHRLTSTEQAIAHALQGAGFTHLPALSRAIREVARSAPSKFVVPPPLIDGLMAWNGLVDPSPRVVVIELPTDRAGCFRRPSPSCQDAIRSLVAQVEPAGSGGNPRRERASSSVFGVGVVQVRSQATRMMIAVLERAALVDPIPSSVAAGRRVAIKGRLLGPRTRPQVEVVEPGGRWSRMATSVSVDGSFRAVVRCEAKRGRYQVEVLAEGEHGPEVAANFPIYCGVPVPKTIEFTIERLKPDATPEQIAWANFQYLNEERKRRNLTPLQWDPGAAKVAEQHSRDMQRNRFVGHRSPRTGNVTDRFARARIQGTVIRENVALGYGPKGIHDSLMRSPGHHANIVAPDVTHVGVGVVIGPRETTAEDEPRPVYATQNMYRRVGAGAPKTARAMTSTMQERIDALREHRKLSAIVWDERLMKVALRIAKLYARGQPSPKGWEKDLFADGYQRASIESVRSPDYRALSGYETFFRPRLEAGIAIVRETTPGKDGFLLILVLAERE